jgi:hypothetical protein
VLADLSGSGEVRATGSASVLTVRTSGSGDFSASALEAEVCKFISSSSASVSVFASRRVEGRLSGSGDVTVHGHPAERQVDVFGSGDVRWD